MKVLPHNTLTLNCENYSLLKNYSLRFLTEFTSYFELILIIMTVKLTTRQLNYFYQTRF